jgi:tRNA nucleotidyltransferase (CCA-adding enzyme)
MASYLKQVPGPQFEVKVQKLTNELLEKLKVLKNLVSIKVLGSVPRKTYLKCNNLDIDIFVYYLDFDFALFLSELRILFPNEVVISKNRGFPYATIELNINHFKVDIVPCIITVVDQVDKTELHNLYLQPLLTTELRDKIRQAKWIIKRIGLYNADSLVKGFSGYTIECLILQYGSLLNVPDELIEFKDPVDRTRNLFASVSLENMQRFHLLKHNKFKTIKKKPISEIYVIKEAPLAWHYTLKKHPSVITCVYISGTLYLEVKDYYINSKKQLDYTNKYWTQNSTQLMYYSILGGLKKITPQKLIAEYGAVRSTNHSDLRVYNYFR